VLPLYSDASYKITAASSKSTLEIKVCCYNTASPHPISSAAEVLTPFPTLGMGLISLDFHPSGERFAIDIES
jgi:hypothetical protein